MKNNRKPKQALKYKLLWQKDPRQPKTERDQLHLDGLGTDYDI
jgi:hypothetical protein